MTRRKSHDQLLIDLALADIDVRKKYRAFRNNIDDPWRAPRKYAELCDARRSKGAARRACLMAGRRLMGGE